MLNKMESHLCEWLLENGTITRHESFNCDAGLSEQWTVALDGEYYNMTKLDGVWVYFFHSGRKGDL